MRKCDKYGEFICPLCAHYEKERLKRSAKKCEERVRKVEELTRELVEVLKKHEQWEADFILDDKVWATANGLPQFTQEVYDAWLEFQTVRNKALVKAKEVLGSD